MNSKRNISTYILCGGLSSRMHQEKGLVLFKEKPFMAHVIAAVTPITNDIYLVTKNLDYEVFGYPLVSDIYENKGPVGGIYTALNHSKTQYNLILSCDIPNINTSVLQTYLLNQSFEQEKVIYLRDEISEYPLIGLYSKAVESKFHDAIKREDLKLLSLTKSLINKAITVEFEDRYALKNINTKEDLTSLTFLGK